jgi:hypothetical protein
LANQRIPIVVGEDGTFTKATHETFRQIAEGCAIDADAIMWVTPEIASKLLTGKKLMVHLFCDPESLIIHKPQV